MMENKMMKISTPASYWLNVTSGLTTGIHSTKTTYVTNAKGGYEKYSAVILSGTIGGVHFLGEEGVRFQKF